MQQDYTEQWQEMYATIKKPMTQFAELNVKTLTSLAKNLDIEEFIKAQKPEEMISAQIKLAGAASLEATRYAQEAFNILLEASSNFGKKCSDVDVVSTYTKPTSRKSSKKNA